MLWWLLFSNGQSIPISIRVSDSQIPGQSYDIEAPTAMVDKHEGIEPEQ